MSLLIAAVGAILAAVVESSVFTQLPVGGIKPDVVFALTMAVAMVMGFEDGMVMAFTGGLMLDLLLPERPVGSSILTLLVVTAICLLVARATEPPRLIVIAADHVRPVVRVPGAVAGAAGAHGGHRHRIVAGDLVRHHRSAQRAHRDRDGVGDTGAAASFRAGRAGRLVTP